MTYDEALEYIHGISWEFCKPGLERIGELCERLGNPERRLRFIHIAGTNGKGSVSTMLASVLKEAGYKVGLYTSPYILRFNERMRIDGEEISDSELAELTALVRPVADLMKDKPTEFELITALSFLYFERHGVDIVVLEAGMGGRLDSTNIITTPIISVITGVALDHTAFLGDTVEKIAREKAGIIKRGVPIVFGGEDAEALCVIREAAAERGSDFTVVDYSALSVMRADLYGAEFNYKERKGLNISLLGLYQPRNAAIVLTVLDKLRALGLSIPEAALREGLLSARWQARFEILSTEPLVIFDGAHNPEGISAAVRSVKHYFGGERVLVLSGVLKDKDYRFIGGELARIASRVHTITPDNKRALSAGEFAEIIREAGTDAVAHNSIGEALGAAINNAQTSGVPLLCLGSLYTYSEVINYLKGEKYALH